MADPHLPSLVTSLKISPDIITVGETITVTVTVTNQAPDPANDFTVSLSLPDSAAPLPPVNTPNFTASKGWSWNQPTLSAGQTARFTANLSLTKMPKGAALTVKTTVSARGLPKPLNKAGGAIVVSQKSGAAKTDFKPGATSLLQSADGQVEIKVPDKAYKTNLKLQHSPIADKLADLKAKNAPIPPNRAGFKGGFGTFVLEAEDDKGQAVHQFDTSLTFTLHYTPEQLEALGIREDDLTLFWFDEAYTEKQATGQVQRGRWLPIATQIDEASHTASAKVNHFSDFQFADGASPSAAFVPSVGSWQDDLFTGAGSYTYPLEIPAGPAGIKPSLSFHYNSAATDGLSGLRVAHQASWVGKGWSMDSGFIAQYKLPNGESTFALVLNGAASDLELNSSGVGYSVAHESFMRVQHSGNGNSSSGRGWFYTGNPYAREKWQVWAKDGTRYDFEEDLWWIWNTDDPNCTGAKAETYKWLLTRVTDTHGNVINYSYNRQSTTRTDLCNSTYSGTADADIWPTWIYWGGAQASGANPRYAIAFNSIARAGDTDFEDSGVYLAPRETRQLQTVQVFSNPTNPYVTNNWQVTASYQLGQDYSLYSDETTYNGGFGPATDYPKLTLKSIQHVAYGGISLPATTFSYGAWNPPASPPYFSNGGWNRLTQINNGQGGIITLNYENIGFAINSFNLDVRYQFRNNHRLSSRIVSDGRGNSYTWNYSYGLPSYNTMGTNLDGDSNSTKAYPNSAALYFNAFGDLNNDNTGWLAHRQNSEFRGHPYVKVVLPDATQSEHWFYQGDVDCNYPNVNGEPITGPDILPNSCWQALRDREFLKGRQWLNRISGPISSGSLRLHETQNTFAVAFYDYSYLGYSFSGIWHAFAYLSQSDSKIYEGAANPWTKTTKYYYDPTYQQGNTQYGNLTKIEEYDRGTLYRYTNRWYKTYSNATSFVVDRLYQEAVYAANGTLMALSNFFHDGGTTPGYVGAVGDLTLTRKYYTTPLTAATIYGTDSAYGYDSFGNLTSTTTYNGAGWYSAGTWSAPGGGSPARTSTTTYDSLFHVFPTQIALPTVNGVTLTQQAGYDYWLGRMNSVTDPNGNVTSAEYDNFGRMIKLIKAGNTSPNPTAWFYYYDQEQPFRYLVWRNDPYGGRPTQTFYDGMGRPIQVKQESADAVQNTVTDTVYDGLGRPIKQSQPRYVSESHANNPGSSYWLYTQPSTDPNVMRWTMSSYDSLGRVRIVTNPDNTSTTNNYQLDSYGPNVATYDAKNHFVQGWSDTFGRLLYVNEYRGNNGNEGAYVFDGQTYYVYDQLDRLKQVRDAANNWTTINYDSLGRKTSMTDPDMGSWSYNYDANGNLTSQTDAKVQTLTFGYDALNRLRTKTVPGGAVTNYNYDEAALSNGKGRRTSMGNATSSAWWHYDARGRVSSATTYVSALGTRTLSFGYDNADRTTSVTYPTGEVVSYTYDAAWRQNSACTSRSGGC